MAILEYKLQAGAGGMRCPDWVEDGGYFSNPDDFSMIGWARDNPEWYTPDTVVKLTAPELEARQLAIHALHPMKNREGDALTIDEVKVMVADWVAKLNEL
jgi:hypothetical protein